MNVTFENALSIATNIGGEDYALQELRYDVESAIFTALYTNSMGVFWLIIQELPYDVLREQLENSRFKMAKEVKNENQVF